MITEEERNKLLYQFNNTESTYPNKPLYILFKEQAQLTPDVKAAISKDQSISYIDLDRKSDIMAEMLTSSFGSITKEIFIGIYFERNINMLISLLAILKVGKAYVPFDIKDPDNRLIEKLNDSSIKIILTEGEFVDKLKNLQPDIEIVDVEDQSMLNNDSISDTDFQSELSIDSPAYMIYTSGTTGKAKGVIVPHRTILNLINHQNKSIKVNTSSNILQFANYAFDVSVQEIFTALLNGATLHITPEEFKSDIDMLLDFIKKRNTQIVFIPPAVINIIFSENINLPNCIKHIVSAGEQLILTKDVKQKILHDHGIIIHNHYGPTETHVISTFTLDEKSPYEQSHIPIGKPISNSQFYILDKHLKLVSEGIAGELYISGDSLALGYNSAEITTEKFIYLDVESIGESKRLYKTGDLVKWLPDGNLIYLGRSDDQIKLRGFRIELSEIESKINQIEGIKQSIVVFDKSLEQIIIYYTSKNSGLDSNFIREYLLARLPDYMIPNHFIKLTEIPLTSNGKVDKKRLPIPEKQIQEFNYREPRTETERVVSQIWSEVLSINKVSIEDNFFKLGGHSLNATQVISRIRRIFEFNCPVKSIFDNQKLLDFCRYIDDNFSIVNKKDHHISVVDREGKLPLSSSQQRLWFIDCYQKGDSSNYNIPIAIHLKGKLDIAILEDSLDLLVSRHESLRTIFKQDSEGNRYQEVLSVNSIEPLKLEIESVEESKLSLAVTKKALKSFILGEYPLMRVYLFEILDACEEYILLVNQHHIISDGWSVGIFFRELSLIYNSLRKDIKPVLEPLEIQYADFSVWQQQYFNSEAIQDQINYWKESLLGYEDLNLPTDKSRPAVQSFNGAQHRFDISSDLYNELHLLSKKLGCTMFMLLLSGYYILLRRYSGQQDFVIGTPIANRNNSQVEDIIGYFVNTLALRISTQDCKIDELINLVKDKCLGAYQHQDLPFEHLVEILNIQRDPSRSAIFQAAIVMDNSDVTENVNFDEISPSMFTYDNSSSKLDITLYFLENKNNSNCSLAFEYSTDLFEHSTIQRMSEHYIKILQSMVGDLTESIDSINYLSKAEYNQLIYDWNNTDTDYPKDKTVIDLFEECAINMPDNIAIISEGRELTYRELKERSNLLAEFILERYMADNSGTARDNKTAVVILDRSIELIVTIFAVMKAGFAYVPISKDEPLERVKQKFEKLEPSIIITDKAFIEYSQETKLCESINTIDINSLEVSKNKYQKKLIDNIEIKPQNLAYIMYTSGSTGIPKGVMIKHESLLNHACSSRDNYDITFKDRILQFSAITFDISIEEIFSTLITGATLILRNKYLSYSIEDFMSFVKQYNITVINLPTAYWNELVNSLEINLVPESLKTVIIGGEKASLASLRRWNNIVQQDIRVFNTYGPTEATVVTSIFEMNKISNLDLIKNIPIGKPVQNSKVYILDQQMKPVPIGVTGELYIGGIGVAEGYLKDSSLTIENFLTNPYEKTTKIYKTGDIVRWLKTGDIDYLGRIDDQVKIRGYRIELGEIESTIAEYPLVNNVVVTANNLNSTSKELVAYIVENIEKDIADKEKENNSPEKETKFVDQWQQIYDETSTDESGRFSFDFDISGWTSSYTNELIAYKEMKEWVNNTISHINSFNPVNILEIGTGSGLLLYPLSKEISGIYFGVDFSQTEIDRLKKETLKLPKRNIQLKILKANEIEKFNDDIGDTNINMVVINSVIQYFPSADYLEQVILKASNYINDGVIFLGDIRDYRLVGEFHLSVYLYNIRESSSKVKASTLMNLVEDELNKEKELLISPEYFIELEKKYDFIDYIELLPKQGKSSNEM